MSRQIDVDLKADHVAGGFSWEKEPKCSCGMVMQAIEDKFIFVSNFVDGKDDDKHSIFYIMPVDSSGFFARSSGVNITNCPWCGDRIRGLKHFPTS